MSHNTGVGFVILGTLLMFAAQLLTSHRVDVLEKKMQALMIERSQ